MFEEIQLDETTEATSGIELPYFDNEGDRLAFVGRIRAEMDDLETRSRELEGQLGARKRASSSHPRDLQIWRDWREGVKADRQRIVMEIRERKAILRELAIQEKRVRAEFAPESHLTTEGNEIDLGCLDRDALAAELRVNHALVGVLSREKVAALERRRQLREEWERRYGLLS